MAEKKRDILVPAFNGGLLEARYLKGGAFTRRTRTQRNQIGKLFRVLDSTFSTLCFVSADNLIYELINNPDSETTSDSDWRIILQAQSGLTPLGTWAATNTDPVLQDTDAAGQLGAFYIVTGAASPTLVNFPGLFGGQSLYVKDGDWVMSNSSIWFVSSQSVTWDGINKPQVITDYVNGTVIDHTHTIDQITGLQGELDDKFDSGDLAPLDVDFDTIPDNDIISLGFLKEYYYRKSQVYSKDEVDGLLPDLSNYYTKSEVDFLDEAVLADALSQVSIDYYNRSQVDYLISSALSTIPGFIIGEVTLAERNALVGGVSVLNTYTLKNRYRVITTDPDDLKWVDEFTGSNGDSGSTFWNRLYLYQGDGVTQFLGLSDVPHSYSGAGGKNVRVNISEDGLEFSPTKRVIVDTTVDVVLNMSYLDSRTFIGSDVIDGDRNWSFLNASNMANSVFLFEISGAFNQVMDFDVISDDGGRFDRDTKTWTPVGDYGKYRASFDFDGTQIWLTISQSIFT